MQKTSPAAKRWFWFAAKLAISLALLIWLFRKFELNTASLAPARYAPLFLALGATCVTIVVAACRWQIILRRYSLVLPFRETFRIQYVAAFMAQFLPGFVGPDAVKVYLATRNGARLSTGIASVMLDRGVAVLGLIFIVAVASLRVMEVVKEEYLRLLLLALSAAACAGTAALILLAGALQRWTARYRWLSPFAQLASGLRDIFRDPRTLAVVLAASVLIHAMYAVGLWAALAAFGERAALMDVFAIFAPVILFQMLPISVGGWGVRELIAVAMLASVGVPGPQALSASIMLGIVQAIASLPGAVAWFVRFNRVQTVDAQGD